MKGEVLYWEKDVDIGKGVGKGEGEYYRRGEGMEKQNVRGEELYEYVKWDDMSKVEEGKYMKIWGKEVDDVVGGGWI